MTQTISEQFTLADLRRMRKSLRYALEALDEAEQVVFAKDDDYWLALYVRRVLDKSAEVNVYAQRLVDGLSLRQAA